MELSQRYPMPNQLSSAPQKSLFIHSQKWKSILKHLNQNEETFRQTEQEKKFQEYLKEGSAQMTSQWTNSIEKTRANKAAERQKREQEKILERERQFKELKEKDEKARLEQVTKAQEMLNRLRMGTNDLESAAILSEVLQAQKIQRNFNVQMKKSATERKRKEADQIEMQSVASIEEHQRRLAEAKKRTDDYKNEVYRMAKDDEKRKMVTSRRQIENERLSREQTDKDVQGQIERERAILQRKKEAMRKNALEAMQMVEQRRLREKMENEIDNKIIDIFAKGKQNIENIRREKERQRLEEIVRIKDANAQRVFVQSVDRSAEEDERIRKAVEESNDKHQEQERLRIERERLRKAARIKQHLEDRELEKMAKENQMEHIRWSIANRLKNEEVTQDFEKMKTHEKVKRAQEIRAVLLEQVKERKEMEKKERLFNDNECSAKQAERDDENFMAYAQTLIENAKKKSRPILPLIRTVDKYRKANVLNVERTEPIHLKTNLSQENGHLTVKSDMAASLKCSQSIIKYDLDELKELNPRGTVYPALFD